MKTPSNLSHCMIWEARLCQNEVVAFMRCFVAGMIFLNYILIPKVVFQLETIERWLPSFDSSRTYSLDSCCTFLRSEMGEKKRKWWMRSERWSNPILHYFLLFFFTSGRSKWCCSSWLLNSNSFQAKSCFLCEHQASFQTHRIHQILWAPLCSAYTHPVRALKPVELSL